jgi:hypothetical protein
LLLLLLVVPHLMLLALQALLVEALVVQVAGEIPEAEAPLANQKESGEGSLENI